MSAVAHTNIEQAKLASVQLNGEPAVTSISVSARIDYIQRFSKQAVLVLDNDAVVYSQAARQYLITISKDKSAQETNVAYVSASTKLNDIQIRCRLIEQLFSNTLFDPEKSLAVSILNLSKESKDSITIVVEHAHALSLQIKYELCQLVDIANKTHNKINVAIFGQEIAARDVAVNKSLFKNKLAIVDAKTGQLSSLDNAKFKENKSIVSKAFLLKSLATIMSVSILIGLTWFIMIEHDSFSLSQLPEALTPKQETQVISQNIVPPLVNADKVTTELEFQASTQDIYSALQGIKTSSEKIEIVPAKTIDILQALDLNEAPNSAMSSVDTTIETSPEPTISSILATDIATKEVQLVEEIQLTQEEKLVREEQIVQKEQLTNEASPIVKTAEIDKVVANTSSELGLTPNYYLNASTGFAVQIVGFTDAQLFKRFIESYPNLEYYSYQKKLNDKKLIVVTSRIFEDREQAKQGLSSLPQEIIDRGVWVKDLAMIQDEIKQLN